MLAHGTGISQLCDLQMWNSHGGCTYISGGSNEPPNLKNYIYIYIYIFIFIFIYCFTNLNHVLNLTHPVHISAYPTIKQQFSALFMYG